MKHLTITIRMSTRRAPIPLSVLLWDWLTAGVMNRRELPSKLECLKIVLVDARRRWLTYNPEKIHSSSRRWITEFIHPLSQLVAAAASPPSTFLLDLDSLILDDNNIMPSRSLLLHLRPFSIISSNKKHTAPLEVDLHRSWEKTLASQSHWEHVNVPLQLDPSGMQANRPRSVVCDDDPRSRAPSHRG